ncbi:hypothetical protein JCM33374_g4527 [Metschnikowia sp. JCM 33374]|nr:hypothetical protein JCM33374_g4527 [Metschnikowia sp. JCM 33374]
MGNPQVFDQYPTPLDQTPTMSKDTSPWYAADEFYDVEDYNLARFATVFHRKIYTFGKNGEVYINFSKLNKNVSSLDDVVLLLTKSCIMKVAPDEYIIVVGCDTKDVSVLGVLSRRFVDTNDLNSFDEEIKDAKDYNVVPIAPYLAKAGVSDFDKHFEAAKARVEREWTRYKGEIDSSYLSNGA